MSVPVIIKQTTKTVHFVTMPENNIPVVTRTTTIMQRDEKQLPFKARHSC